MIRPPGSGLPASGLQSAHKAVAGNDDVITGVKGEKITGPTEAARFFEQFAE
jgi:hypothetical protein